MLRRFYYLYFISYFNFSKQFIEYMMENTNFTPEKGIK